MTARARPWVALAAACAAAATALVAPAPAGAQDAGGGVDRVLLISVPGLTWAEVRDHDLPAIEGLLEDAALADMAPRGVSPRATPGAAYLTISAGSRATSDPLVDGQQLAVDEQAGGSTAGEIFERRTGDEPDGRYVSLSWPTLERVNARQPYDAELGLLAETLDEDGLGVEAIGNADGTDSVSASYERQVGLAATTGDGVIPAGALGPDLLVRDPSRPFGERLDIDSVMERFEDAWAAPAGRDGGLVVVEASDLARSMRYRDRVDIDRYEELRSQALEDTDRLVAELLAEVDPERDAVLLVAPYNLPDDRDLTVSALRAPGQEAGYLRSASTQRSGFLTLVDVAPTVLDLLDVPRPVEMEGRPAEVVASGASLPDRVDHLVAAERGVAVPGAAAVPDHAGRGRGPGPAVRGHDRGPGPGRRGPPGPGGAGVPGAGRPGGAAAVVRGPRLPAGGPGRRVLLGVPRDRGGGRGGGGHRRRAPGRGGPGGAGRRAGARARRAAGRRDDRVPPQPQLGVRLLADRQLPAVRHQQLRLRPGGRRVVPAGRVRGRAVGDALAVGPPPSGCSRRCSSSSACRCGDRTSAGSSPSRRPCSCSRPW